MERLGAVNTIISITALVVALASFFRDSLRERFRRRAQLEVWERGVTNVVVGSEDSPRYTVILLFRNLSPRPTAVIDVFVRAKEGGILFSAFDNEKVRGPFPVKVDGWGVATVTFPLAREYKREAANISVFDIEGNEIVIPQSPDRRDWYRVQKAQRRRA